MDGWQVAQNYFGFAVLAGGLGGYYYYTTKRSQPAAAGSRRRSTNDFKVKPDRRPSVQQREPAQPSAVTEKQEKQNDAAGSKKKKAAKKQQQQQQQQAKAPAPVPAPEVVVHEDKPEKESDLSNAQFAQQMIQARQGSKLAAPKGKENRVKTVKQSSARDTPILSSGSSQTGGETGAEADDDLSPAASPPLNSGDVSDMLEAKPSGPTSIRLTAPTNPQKERAPKQAKEQVVESKKARQNRKKVEERRIQREAEEKERKALEERQRRSAREARGEPAKNGIPAVRAPVNNPWEEKNASAAASVQTGAVVNGASNGPLLDTFDAESTGSSNGGLEVSSAATSTTDANPSQYGNEDAQVAKAMKESEDESGWTTVSVGKKQQKSRDEPSGEVTPIEQPQPKPKAKAPLPPKPSTFAANSAKPTGFAALDVDDPANWDA
jgi:hypothetical protein